MTLRLLFAIAMGALIGLERETVGKEAGVRTGMVVSGGAALFTIINLALPDILKTHGFETDGGAAITVIGNIVTGIGFLGAGLIIKDANHVRGLTTAAVVWFTAAIGVLSGLGMFEIALSSTVILAGMLYLLRNVSFASPDELKPEKSRAKNK